jgi:hypothetical protein
MDTQVQVMQFQPRSSPTAVIGPHWPAYKFEHTWTPLSTKISTFEHTHNLSRGTSPLLTATAQHIGEITHLIKDWANLSVQELGPACGMERAPRQEVKIRLTTARKALATKQSIRPQPSIALQRIARALQTVTHAYAPARSRELTRQLRALERPSTRAWLNRHLADCPTRPGIDEVLAHLRAITARHEAHTARADVRACNGTGYGTRTPPPRLNGACLSAHDSLALEGDHAFAAWADLLQVHNDLNTSAALTAKMEWKLSGSARKRFLDAALEEEQVWHTDYQNQLRSSTTRQQPTDSTTPPPCSKTK